MLVSALDWTSNPGLLVLLALPASIGFLALLLVRPEVATLLFVAALYANLPVNLGRIAGNPVWIGALTILLIGVPVCVELFVKRRRPVLDGAFLLMVLFLAVLLLSTLFARDPRVALGWITTYLVEGVLVYVLVVNAVRRLSTLRRVIWTLILAGSFLGCLSIYQEVTGAYHERFGGLAQRDLSLGLGDAEENPGGERRSRSTIHLGHRAGGPIGGPNRYGQILVIVLPFALIRMRSEKSRLRRVVAAAAAVTILGGVFLTYSRGTFLTLTVLVTLMVFMRAIPIRHFVAGAVVLAVLAIVVAPGSLERMDSIRGVQALFSQKSAREADGPTRGRVTEMLAAFNVFRDHPWLGVGPGHFSPYYSVEYMNDPDISLRTIDRPRRAHSLYFELAAEAGLLGFVVFMSIPLLLGSRLWRLRRNGSHLGRELSVHATELWLSLVAYFGTAVFLHLSYQRYYWLLMALAGATVQILTARQEAATGSEGSARATAKTSERIGGPTEKTPGEAVAKTAGQAAAKTIGEAFAKTMDRTAAKPIGAPHTPGSPETTRGPITCSGS